MSSRMPIRPMPGAPLRCPLPTPGAAPCRALPTPFAQATPRTPGWLSAMSMYLGPCLVGLLLSSLFACHGSSPAPAPTSPFSGLPVSQTITGGVDSPVDIVRDQYGIPHIYGASLTDVSYAEGYVMAQDRFVQMDLLRHFAAGTTAELLGSVDASLIDSDIAMRVHHLQSTAQAVWQQLTASTAAEDQAVVAVLTHFTAGVNAYVQQLAAGNGHLPYALALVYDIKTTAPWAEVDSLVLARLQAFELAFDADTELERTQVEDAAVLAFDNATNPALKTRAGLSSDLFREAPIADAFILPDAQSCAGQMAIHKSPASGAPAKKSGPSRLASAQNPKAPKAAKDTRALYPWKALRLALSGIGLDRSAHPSRGSNDWVAGPSVTGTGNAIVSNDTHLDLSNPPVFYLVHLNVQGQLNLMGVQFPGLPGVVLGMNDHLAWGATVTNADVTDLYNEQIVDCTAAPGTPCVVWQDPNQPGPAVQVALTPRPEVIRVGRFGTIISSSTVTLYDVPQHGPILPQIVNHTVAAPAAGSTQISVRYTGYQPTLEIRAILNLDQATSVSDGIAAIERDFGVGGQNWVMADTGGQIGWTTHVILPVRPAGTKPWRVLPGDGSAEWIGSGVPAAQQPRAINPSCALIVTANNDPLGATRDDGPVPPNLIYHGWDYDIGARAERITTLLRQGETAAGRLSTPGMQTVQADHHSYLGQLLLPVLLDSADKLAAEIATPGSYADLSALAAGLSAADKASFADARTRLHAWTLTTSSGLDNEASAPEVADAIATTIFHVWLNDFIPRTLDDEFAAINTAAQPLGVPSPDEVFQHKLIVAAALYPTRLHVGLQGNGDSLLFDDLTTPAIETMRQIAAQSIIAALQLVSTQLGADPTKWQWGRIHRLTLEPQIPISTLAIPAPSDPTYPTGVPRHGDLYSVDVGDFGLRQTTPNLLTDYTYGAGPAIRFVAELKPSGPSAFNVIPGGETFDPDSRHYADQFALWRHNQSFALPFDPTSVAASATIEQNNGGAAHVQITP